MPLLWQVNASLTCHGDAVSRECHALKNHMAALSVPAGSMIFKGGLQKGYKEGFLRQKNIVYLKIFL
jgi:hypothetical protein